MNILHLDKNHSLLIDQLNALGFTNDEDYTSSKEAIEKIIHKYDGIIIRSRFKVDKQFLDAAENLKFIGRVGAGLENIDCDYAEEKGIKLIAAPEGNRNAVGEHSLGMLLSLFNKLHTANREVRQGQWRREENRGLELDGKIVGLIGYGHMGKSFSKKLKGFDVEVLCYDIKEDVGDENAKQVSLQELQEKVDVISLHTPETTLTINMVNSAFINGFKNPFWLINTARGKSVVTKDLVSALESGNILGAGLDVLEYEKSSFENLFKPSMTSNEVKIPEAFKYLISADNVILTPHVAGWTIESKEKLSQTIVDKIKKNFVNFSALNSIIMHSKATSPKDYIGELPVDRQVPITKLDALIRKYMPKGLEAGMGYGMLAYYVPKSIYPDGYHCKPFPPLPFINLASQKNFIALYHMGMYAKKELYDWFVAEYPKYSNHKLDMGKSCVRFKKMEDIPYDLIEQLLGKMSVEEWIGVYEAAFKNKTWFVVVTFPKNLT